MCVVIALESLMILQKLSSWHIDSKLLKCGSAHSFIQSIIAWMKNKVKVVNRI